MHNLRFQPLYSILVIHVKTQKDRWTIKPFILGNINQIVGATKAVINEMAKKTDIEVKGYPTTKQLEQICEQIGMNEEVALLFLRGD